MCVRQDARCPISDECDKAENTLQQFQDDINQQLQQLKKIQEDPTNFLTQDWEYEQQKHGKNHGLHSMDRSNKRENDHHSTTQTIYNRNDKCNNDRTEARILRRNDQTSTSKHTQRTTIQTSSDVHDLPVSRNNYS